MKYYRTVGVCAREIGIKVDGGRIERVEFLGGCHGNLQGIAKLLEGMTVEDTIYRLRGIRCQNKETSCPDQLVKALEGELKES